MALYQPQDAKSLKAAHSRNVSSSFDSGLLLIISSDVLLCLLLIGNPPPSQIDPPQDVIYNPDR